MDIKNKRKKKKKEKNFTNIDFFPEPQNFMKKIKKEKKINNASYRFVRILKH